MKSFLFSRPSERGQAIVLIAIAIAGLVAITGLAIDGGFAFSDRRHAQNAADASALAGALKKINPDDPAAANAEATTMALNIANEHGIPDSDVTVEIPPASGPYKDNNDYIQVFIETHRDTFFAKVIGIDQTHNKVEAVARAKGRVDEALYGGNTLVALKPHSTDCSGDFVFGGNGSVTIDGGGVFINSDNNTCAYQQSGNCSLEEDTLYNFTDPDGDPVPISIVGNLGYTAGSCDEVVNASFASGQTAIPWPDGVHLLDPPKDACNPSNAGSYTAADGVVTFQPGYYTGKFPKVTGPHSGDPYELESGIYCIDELNISSDISSKEGGVFFYVRSGKFGINGGTNTLEAMTIEPGDPGYKDNYSYSGFLIYAATDLTGTTPNCTLNGNQDSSIVGTIYAPYCDVTINGTTGSTEGFHSQVVAYELKLLGNAELGFIYVDDENGRRIENAQLDLTQ